MTVSALSYYEPAWIHGRNRVCGPDEDLVTAAVATALPLIETAPCAVDRVIVVTRTPDITEGWASGVVARALGLGSAASVELRVGDAPAVLDVLARTPGGTVVVAVDLGTDSAAAAAALLVDGPGLDVDIVNREIDSLPMRVRHVGQPQVSVYDDSRVERDLFLTPLTARLLDGRDARVTGAAPAFLKRLGGTPEVTPTSGAAAALFALRNLAGTAEPVRLIALGEDGVVAAEVRVSGQVAVTDLTRPGQDEASQPRLRGALVEIPFSMPAYARAFPAKIGLVAAQCVCGEVSYPPREVCLKCGRVEETKPVGLPRTGVIYTVVPVHAPIPGIPGPYALAIVQLDESPVRVLAPVTDAAATAARIGDPGRLVLRRLSVREGVPDYGYAFQVDDRGITAVAEEVAL
jgi:uncharacterized OB-fold protein